MDVFDSKVPRDIVINLMDDNGCCKSQTARDKASKEFARCILVINLNRCIKIEQFSPCGLQERGGTWAI